VARIHSLDALPRLLTLAASHTAQLLNVSDLAAPFQMTRQTIYDYVTVLERIFLLDRLLPWHRNRVSRLVKTAKLHIGDTGLACALLGIDATALYEERDRLGPLLETFVLQELRRQASWHPDPLDFFHYRDRDDFEVDIVLERGSVAVAGVEVKSAASVTDADFRGLRKLSAAAGRQFAAGVVLYDGGSVVRFGERLFAVPVRILWED
jgi:predicted AAA+ superfamily ATPase